MNLRPSCSSFPASEIWVNKEPIEPVIERLAANIVSVAAAIPNAADVPIPDTKANVFIPMFSKSAMKNIRPDHCIASPPGLSMSKPMSVAPSLNAWFIPRLMPE